MSAVPPVDAAARRLIELDGLGHTLFVEAGAGTGKTHELVNRVVNLVRREGVALRNIAAITFTEAAGAELRDRIREELEKTLAAPLTEPEREACEAALADTDVAAIGTLHSFALRILNEHPLDVGLPPRIDLVDEVSSQLAFEDRWDRFVDGLHEDPASQDLILTAAVLGIDIEPRPNRASLKDVAALFDDNWDRLGADDAPPEPLPTVDWAPLERARDRLVELRTACHDPDDLLLARIDGRILPEVDAVLRETDPFRRLHLLGERCDRWKGGGSGKAANWDEVKAVRADCDAVGAAAAEIRTRLIHALLEQLRRRLVRFTREAADERRREGRLEFHDLLVLGRELVRHSATARATLHDRYERLLLDEVQDTDPLQIEIATLIAGAVAGAAPDSWPAVPVPDGRLFFVGDPKQSIYRFRRADIDMFLRARTAFAPDGAVALVQNFRTVGPVLDWVNHVFTAVMPDEVPGAQPQYRRLDAAREGADGVDHRVVLLGGPVDGLKAAELRVREATDVARAIASVRDHPDRWPVRDATTERWRRPSMADVTVLLPTRTSLRQLEDAFDAQAIPYRVDTGTLVYDTQEVREVLAALRAVDDPTDELALVTALRSPLYGCSDADLFTWFDAGGRWDLRRPAPDALVDDHPVARSVAHLRSLWDERWWSEPSALMNRLLRERQAFALAFAKRRPREVWRRLRFLVDQAHQFEESGGGGLRAFLRWAELQTREGSRVHEPLLPETDDDAVSIMTIHGAKGLEFPITVVSGVTTKKGNGRRGPSVNWEGDRPEIRFNSTTKTEHFDRLADIELEMDGYERDRLLYVACTRARDHLVVCTHHSPKASCHGATLFEHSHAVEGALCRRLDDPSDLADRGDADAPAAAQPTGDDPPTPPLSATTEVGAAAAATEVVEPTAADEFTQVADATRATAAADTMGSAGVDEVADAPDATRATAADEADEADEFAEAPGAAASVDPTGSAPRVGDDRDAWRAAREALLGPQRTSRFVSATAVARWREADPADQADRPGPPDLAGGLPADADADAPDHEAAETGDSGRPPFAHRRGRAGSAIGRAVHATLQLVDLATGDGVADLSAQQAHAEAVPHAADTVEALVRSALGSTAVRAAVAGGRLWREAYVAAPVGAHAVEGYVDLLYETTDGLVIVDYKTDAVRSDAEVDAKLDQYRLQLATYAEALATGTGLAVAAGRLVFCQSGAAIERDVPDLDGARAEVRARLAAAPA